MYVFIASIIVSIAILSVLGGVVGSALILFSLLLGFGLLSTKHLSTSQVRKRKNLFEDIYLISAIIIASALASWYLLSENLPVKDEAIRAGVAFALVVAVLIVVRFIIGRIYRKDNNKEIKAKQKKEFDLPIEKNEIDEEEIRVRGYGVDPVFALDGSIARVELKNPYIVEGVIKEFRKKKPAEGVVVEALVERFGVEIVEDSIVKTRGRIYNAARKAIRRGEVIRLQQLLQYARDDEEAGFILFLQNLKSGKFPPLAVPFAIFYMRSARRVRERKKEKSRKAA